MARSISTGMRNAIEATRSGSFFPIFATIEHVNLVEPIRVVSDVVDYIRDGNRFIGCPFEIELLNDGEQAPRGRISIQNVDQEVGAAIEDVTDSPRLMLEILDENDFGAITTVDDRRTRQPIGTPVVEYAAEFLSLKNISGDAMVISAEITSFDVSREPWPGIRTTEDRLPCLYR